jgi:carbamoyltransferase
MNCGLLCGPRRNSPKDSFRLDREGPASDHPLYHRPLLEAGKATGLPVLYNTSFNLFGDPLVSTPRDAVRSFYSSGIDGIFVGNFLLEK